jgi:hypothetical protein
MTLHMDEMTKIRDRLIQVKIQVAELIMHDQCQHAVVLMRSVFPACMRVSKSDQLNGEQAQSRSKGHAEPNKASMNSHVDAVKEDQETHAGRDTDSRGEKRCAVRSGTASHVPSIGIPGQGINDFAELWDLHPKSYSSTGRRTSPSTHDSAEGLNPWGLNQGGIDFPTGRTNIGDALDKLFFIGNLDSIPWNQPRVQSDSIRRLLVSSSSGKGGRNGKDVPAASDESTFAFAKSMIWIPQSLSSDVLPADITVLTEHQHSEHSVRRQTCSNTYVQPGGATQVHERIDIVGGNDAVPWAARILEHDSDCEDLFAVQVPTQCIQLQ